MQYAKTVQVNPDAIEKVTEELSKEISRNASTSTVTAAQVGKIVANETPLIEKISDMDSDYQELVYVGLMRKRNTTEWLCDIGNPVIYGYYDFYE